VSRTSFVHSMAPTYDLFSRRGNFFCIFFCRLIFGSHSNTVEWMALNYDLFLERLKNSAFRFFGWLVRHFLGHTQILFMGWDRIPTFCCHLKIRSSLHFFLGLIFFVIHTYGFESRVLVRTCKFFNSSFVESLEHTHAVRGMAHRNSTSCQQKKCGQKEMEMWTKRNVDKKKCGQMSTSCHHVSTVLSTFLFAFDSTQ